MTDLDWIFRTDPADLGATPPYHRRTEERYVIWNNVSCTE